MHYWRPTLAKCVHILGYDVYFDHGLGTVHILSMKRWPAEQDLYECKWRSERFASVELNGSTE